MNALIEYCYIGGDLPQALDAAAKHVKFVGERNVVSIASTYSEDIGWTVLVVHYEKQPLRIVSGNSR